MVYNNFGNVFFNKALLLVVQDVLVAWKAPLDNAGSHRAVLKLTDLSRTHFKRGSGKSPSCADTGTCSTPGSSSPLRSVPCARGCCWSSPPLSLEWTLTLSREDLAPQVSWLLLSALCFQLHILLVATTLGMLAELDFLEGIKTLLTGLAVDIWAFLKG